MSTPRTPDPHPWGTDPCPTRSALSAGIGLAYTRIRNV